MRISLCIDMYNNYGNKNMCVEVFEIKVEIS